MKYLKFKNRDTRYTDREGGLKIFLDEISKAPLLTASEEVELAKRIKSGDTVTVEQLAISNLRFVVSMAKQYQNNGLNLNDLINEAYVGTVRAAELLDETRGFKFISYAVWWIRQKITYSIAKYGRTITLSFNAHILLEDVKKTFEILEKQLEREPIVDEVFDYLKQSKKYQESKRSRGRSKPKGVKANSPKRIPIDKHSVLLALDVWQNVSSIDRENEDGEPFLFQVIENKDAEFTTDEIDTADREKRKRQFTLYLQNFLGDEKAFLALCHYYGLNGFTEKTLFDIAPIIGVKSQETVRTLINGSIKKLSTINSKDRSALRALVY